MSIKKFTVTFDGEITQEELEEVIYNGLQFFEDVNWNAYSVTERKD